MKEADIEDALLEGTECAGGFCIKLPAIWYTGIPDRLLLLPGGRAVFVELKRPVGGRMGRLQPWWRDQLQRLGFRWVLLKTVEEVKAFFDAEAPSP